MFVKWCLCMLASLINLTVVWFVRITVCICVCLYVSLCAAEAQIMIAALGGLPLLLTCIQVEDIELRCYALATLMHLASNGMPRGCIDMCVCILCCVVLFLPPVITRVCVCLSVRFAAANCTEFGKMDGVSSVCALLRVSDPDTRRFAAGAIATLCATNGT